MKVELATKLLPHQKAAIDWGLDIVNNKTNLGIKGGIFNLMMGLGKTLTSLYLSLKLREKLGSDTAALVVCDKSILGEWEEQANKHFKKETFKLKCVRNVRGFNVKDVKIFDVIVVSYDTLLVAYNALQEGGKKKIEICSPSGKILGIRQNKTALKTDDVFGVCWSSIFADECDRFSNTKTAIFRAMMLLNSKTSWCLSGTVISNGIEDLYAFYRFIGWDEEKNVRGWNAIYYEKLKRFMIRIDYEAANIKLPPLQRKKIKVKLNKMERACYDRYFKQWKPTYENYEHRLCTNMDVIALFNKLRQATLDVTMLCDTKCKDYFSTKVRATALKIKEIVSKGESVVVFCTYNKPLENVKRYIEEEQSCCSEKEEKGIKISIITGKVGGNKRKEEISKFKRGDTQVLLSGCKVGGKGLNLANANHVIVMDYWWTWKSYVQSVARVHRIQQNKTVTVWTLEAVDTIDQYVKNVMKRKKDTAETVDADCKISIIHSAICKYSN